MAAFLPLSSIVWELSTHGRAYLLHSPHGRKKGLQASTVFFDRVFPCVLRFKPGSLRASYGIAAEAWSEYPLSLPLEFTAVVT